MGRRPGATTSRSKRERPAIGGRTQEIQRLIGRSLRGVMDLKRCPDLTFIVDCDILQADGGTRTASITGGYVALKMAVDRLLRKGRLKVNPLTTAVAAVSVGIKSRQHLLYLWTLSGMVEHSGATKDQSKKINDCLPCDRIADNCWQPLESNRRG